ncbi:MAG: hypothetical protein MAG551_02619 [Candidatus Scalindua arabica]|uniref:Type IV pili twitching motility protein PilT n=1 Tax=Candidatus Scalindua arabica TaxID=1127984 RepID=A0A942A7C5_9BACT|nr:hypothetical protein [Candidatus Scalindua arabica]
MNIEELLKLMVEKAASDIYITVDSAPAYRVEGKTEPIPEEALKPEDTNRFICFYRLTSRVLFLSGLSLR